jgi:hypothetical protein
LQSGQAAPLSVMLEILAANPNKQFDFEDEKDAQTMVEELDLTSQVYTSQQSILHFGNFTHYIQVIRKNNRFVVMCYPRSKVTYHQFIDHSQYHNR